MALSKEELAAKLKYARRRCLTDLHFLITEVLYSHDKHKYGEHHRQMCLDVAKGDYLETNSRGGKYWRPAQRKRSMHLEPRDHFKSSILVIGHLTQQILRNPTGSYLLLSGKDEHALLFSDDIRKLFAYNERLMALFPPWACRTPDEMGSKSEWTTPAKKFFGGKRREPTVVATGFKSRLESRHYEGGYLDDCMGEDDTSEVGLAEVRENYKKVIPLIDSDGFVIMPGTRKHYGDLYAALMDTGIYDVHVQHGLQGEQDCKLPECAKALPHKAPDYQNGTPLEPKRMTKEDYQRKLAECQVDPKMGEAYFWHEYMNIPLAPQERRYQLAWFRQIADEMVPGQAPPYYPLKKFITIDSAWKDNSRGTGMDYTVIIAAGFDDHGNLYCFDGLRSRSMTVKPGLEVVVSLMKRYDIHDVVYQKTGEMTWPGDLKDACRRAGIPLVLTDLTVGGRNAESKFQRMLRPQRSFESGRVFFAQRFPFFKELRDEFMNLGRWSHDDAADALSNLYDPEVRVLPPPVKTPMVTPSYRPMSFEGGARRAGFAASQPKAENDPLGRFGMQGPADTAWWEQRFGEMEQAKNAPQRRFRHIN